MKLPPQLLQRKTLMIAILTLARQIAEALDVDLSAPLAQTCRTLRANRTSSRSRAGKFASPSCNGG